MITIRKLLVLIGKRAKFKFLLLFALMIIAALFEMVSIGLIVPYVGLVTNPSGINDSPVLLYLYEIMGIQSTRNFIIIATISLISVFIVKNLYLTGFYYVQYRIIYNEQLKMSKRLFQAYMTKPYTFHLQRNSANLLRNTNIEVQRIYRELISPMFMMLTELLVVTCIFILLIAVAPGATLLSTLVLGGSVIVFFGIFRSRLTKAAVAQQEAQGDMIKWVNQGLGAVKEVSVLGREKFFIDEYSRASGIYASTQRYFVVMNQVPRLFIETIIVATILLIILVIMLQSTDLTTLLTTISLFTMAAFRLMPSLSRLISGQTVIRSALPALEVIYSDLIVANAAPPVPIDQLQYPNPIHLSGKKSFTKSIDIQNVSYRYPGSHEDAIHHVSLSIPIDKSVAIVGPSGSGKTTIVDIILGVLAPTEGNVMVDGYVIKDIGHAWKQSIGYIPQYNYLSDDSIRRNIAFGIKNEEIDDNSIWQALEQAQLIEFVKALPDQLDTFVGERGVRLSGGQRQRIGIARALYHKPEILFMDEATSSLDHETENEIMKAIDGLRGEKTLIIIAHRLSTIENCDIIFRLDKGRLVEVQ